MRILFILLMLATNCFAVVNDGTTIIPDFTDQSMPVLNNTLSEYNRRIQQLEGTTSATVGNVASGGTGLSTATDDTVLVGLNSTTYQLRILPNCPSGSLAYTHSTNTFSCATPYFNLIGTSTVTSATDTATITIAAGKTYKMIVTMESSAGAGGGVRVIFNSDTTGTDYEWVNTKVTILASPVETHTGAVSVSNGIKLSNDLRNDNGYLLGEYFIHTYQNQTSGFNAHVIGSGMIYASAAVHTRVDATGVYSGGSPTSVMLQADGTADVLTITIYEMTTL